MKFGENLKNIRKYKKISQEELSEKLGVSRQSISKWETGENYPSMTNIMCLCDIFNCKINELVHEDMTDIDSLDEEIKMNVVKFKKEEQRKMKGISKIIYIASRIANKIALLGIVISVAAAIILNIVVASSNINTNNNEIKVFDEKVTYVLNQEEFSITNNNEKEILISDLKSEEVKTIEKSLNLPKGIQMLVVVLFSISLIASLFIIIKLTSYIEKLFKNIHDNDTPFNMDNVLYMKKIALYLLLYIMVSDVFGGIAQGISTLNFEIEIELQSYFSALVVLGLSYVFKYGYEIQLDSKGKIYGDINE